jgi:hypothetical protein
MFVNKYEKIVPWQTIKSKEDIVQFIDGTLVPDLYQKIDANSPNNNYMKDIDLLRDFERNMGDPQVQQAARIYRNDPEGSKKIVLDAINDNKRNSFYEWWEYMTNENDVYSANGAFLYLMLKPIFDSSPETKRVGPLSSNPMAIASVYESIENGATQINLLKAYKKSLGEVDTMALKSTKSGEKEGWLRIPSKINDQKGFEENVKRLKNLSIPRGWCTGTGMARTYLSTGDFWLYIEGSEARVAIRFDGNMIAEIQGHQNTRPFEYWEEITQLVSEHGFDTENRHYRELLEAKEINERLDNDPSYVEEFKDEFMKDSNLFNMLSKERQNSPEFLGVSVEYWELRIINADKDGTNLSGTLSSKLDTFRRAPNKVKPHLDREVMNLIMIDIDRDLNRGRFDYVAKAVCDNNDFLNMYNVAEEFVDMVTPFVANTPWRLAVLSPRIIMKIDAEIVDRAQRADSYQLIADLESCGDGSANNPEDILESYFDDFDEFDGRPQYELDEIFQESEEAKSPDLYDEALCVYIENHLGRYWKEFVAIDPIDRFPELEENLGHKERYADWDDYYEIRDMFETAWHEKINDNPREVDNLDYWWMFENIMYDEEEGSLDWYVEAWVNYVEQNMDWLFDAKGYLEEYGNDQNYLEKYYEEIFSEVNYSLLQNYFSKKPNEFFDIDNLNIVNNYSEFLDSESGFVADLMTKFISENPNRVGSFYEEIEFLHEECEVLSDEQFDSYQRMYRDKKLQLIKEEPHKYKDLDTSLQGDEEIRTHWKATLERWVELLWSHGDSIVSLNRAPDEVLNHPTFQEEVKKYRIAKTIRHSIEEIYRFEEIVSPYGNDKEFYEKAYLSAKMGYINFMEPHNYFDKIEEGTNIAQSVPSVFLEDDEVLDKVANKIKLAFGHYPEKLQGDEVKNMHPALRDRFVPALKGLVDKLNMDNYQSVLGMGHRLSEVYHLYPNMFQDNYDAVREAFIELIKRRYATSILLKNFPKLFKNDQEVLKMARESLKNRGYDPSENPVLTEQSEEEEGEVTAKTNKNIHYSGNNWYKYHKIVKVAQNIQFIESYDVRDIVEGFGTRRFTIGFRKKDGSFRMMNCQKRVQRPYSPEENIQREWQHSGQDYLTLYDLQIASQVAKEALSEVDVNEVDPSLLRAAYRKVYPHTVEFIKGDGNIYVVRRSKYALENDLIDGEVEEEL